jgi:hypothetical protein
MATSRDLTEAMADVMNFLKSASSEVLYSMVVGCILLFIAGFATFLGIWPLDLTQVHRRPAKMSIRWMAAGVAVAVAGALIPLSFTLASESPTKQPESSNGIVVRPSNASAVAEVSFTIPEHQQPGSQLPTMGCGRQRVQLRGTLPSSETIVVATESSDATQMQVESDPYWNQAENRWEGLITLSNTWKKNVTYQLTAYVMPRELVSYIRTAADGTSGNTWWWASTAPPGSARPDQITVQLNRGECP